MLFEKDYMPQFRESEADGLVGLRGYLNYFQDMATGYMHNIGKGNDTLPEEYGIAWVYTKYKLLVKKRADFSGSLHMETWVSKTDKVRVWQEMEISRGGEVYAQGRVESCLCHLGEKRLCVLQDVAFPQGLAVTRDMVLAPFGRRPKKAEGMVFAYMYQVRYTDIDKSGHMNNLCYVNMFMDAFSPDFYAKNRIMGFELHYLSQCYYGETLRIHVSGGAGYRDLFAIKEDGTLAAQCRMELE